MHRCGPTSSIAAMIAALTLTVVSCGGDGSDDVPTPQEANPASAFCIAQGGEVEIVDNGDGEVGVCHLADGTSVDEWEYFRDNNPDPTDD